MENNKKKNNKKIVIGLFILFLVLLGTTLYVSFSTLLQEDEIVIKSMTPVYDETSGVVVENENVIFNDKNQIVKYNVVLENTQDYDVKISDITLSTPTEEFLDYKVEGISKDDVLKATSTKELVVSFETTGIKGWGRNFDDELIANISFEKQVKQEEPTPPAEDDKEEEKQPEAPATNIEELTSKTEKIEVTSITNNVIEFKKDIKVEEGKKVAVWIYSEPKFLGYFEVVETNGVKQIVGLEEALKKAEVNPGEHNIVLATEDGEALGYIEVYVSENNTLSQEKPEDIINEEESTPEGSVTTKPSTGSNNKDNEEENDEKVENPYTSDKGLLVVLVTATGVTGLAIVLVSKNNFAKYSVLIIMLCSTLTLVSAEKIIELPIKVNVSFKSQNVMSKAYEIEKMYCEDIPGCDEINNYYYFWNHGGLIQNIYIQNEKTEIKEFAHKYDVTEEQNGRVMAYLVEGNDEVCYTYADAFNYEEICGKELNLYIQADGIIYPNSDASYYFADMVNLDSINNIEGLDTSNVTDMSHMFYQTGYNSTNFTLDVSNFDTSNVTDMSFMFFYTGESNPNFTLDVSNFDTSNVTDMSGMFNRTGYNSSEFTLDLSNFDTSNVTDMSWMFYSTGYNSSEFTLDLSNFDTSNVTSMDSMFELIGYNSTNFTLDVSNFDTSNVTSMDSMFELTGFNSPNFTLDVSNFNTSKVTDMSYMFRSTGYSNPNFTLDVSNFDTSNVTDMSGMFISTGANSTKLNTSITIKNPFILYGSMFNGIATKPGSQIIVNYTSKTEELVDEMIATKSSNSNVVKGVLVEDNNIYIGDEISIGDEKFNVISQTDDTITMLAQYSLDENYRQSETTLHYVPFSDYSGWEYTPGPKEVDIQSFDGPAKTYVNAYVEYLKTELGDNSVTGNLITLKELQNLGCSIQDDYSMESEELCLDSPYVEWIVNGELWWVRSASPNDFDSVWQMFDDGFLYECQFYEERGVRPTITMSKETFKSYMEYVDSLKKYNVGEEISIGEEKFNVISDNGVTVSMLAQYNIGEDNKQSEAEYPVAFSNGTGWEFENGYINEINVQTWGGDSKVLLNNYVSYLKSEYNVDVTGNLITLYQLNKLGCTVPYDYVLDDYEEGRTCTESIHNDWLVNGHYWWTRSAVSGQGESVWMMGETGHLHSNRYYNEIGLRPVITISKEALKNYLKTS